MHSLFVPLFGASQLLTLAIAQNVVSLAPAAHPTAGTSFEISPSFAGFGIEPSNLYSFTGGTSTNQLSINLLMNLANYTGTPPHFRIGGNTQDYMIYERSMDDYEVMVNPNPTLDPTAWFPQNYYIFGPRFFEVLNRFPRNTPITYGLNLAYHESDAVDQNVESANAAYTQLTNLNVVSFEIGNEPDLYVEAGYRDEPWSGTVYTQEWLTRAKAVWQSVLQPKGIQSNFFEPGCTASTIGTTFEIDMLIQDGITAKATDSAQTYVASWNQHDYYYYIGVSTYALTIDTFTDFITTENQFAYWTTEVTEALDSGYHYALREMGVVGPIGMNGITNVFSAALWTLNFFLYAATLNISSVNMHMTDNSNASAWQPIPYYGNQPHIRPNYYAWAAFDQTIGPTCQARVSPYIIPNPPSAYEGRVRAYSVYQAGTLASIVVINSLVANASETNKGSLTVELTLPAQFAGDKLYLSYLTADGADSLSGTTWNGISFEKSGDGTPTRVSSAVSTVAIGSSGKATVTVRDTQALVANIGAEVGTRKFNQAACSSLAASRSDAYVSFDSSTDAYDVTTAGSSVNRTASEANRPLVATLAIIGVLLSGLCLL